MQVTKMRTNSGKSSIWHLLLNLIVYVQYPILIITFVSRTFRFPNAAFPSSIEEKFLWRKIFDHNPLFARTSDKLAAKTYAASICPELRIPEVYWRGTDLNEVPAGLMEKKAVLKANHGSGFNEFLPYQKANLLALQMKTKQWLSRCYGSRNGEWAYGNIDRKLFIEELIYGKNRRPPIEYKIHACNGNAVWIFCLRDRFGDNPIATFFKPDGTTYQDDGNSGFEVHDRQPGDSFSQALHIAQQLGADFDYIRCDFYENGGEIFFGELTTYPLSGYPRIRNQLLLKDWNQAWDLRDSWFLRNRQQGWRAGYAAILRSHLDAPIKQN